MLVSIATIISIAIAAGAPTCMSASTWSSRIHSEVTSERAGETIHAANPGDLAKCISIARSQLPHVLFLLVREGRHHRIIANSQVRLSVPDAPGRIAEKDYEHGQEDRYQDDELSVHRYPSTLLSE